MTRVGWGIELEGAAADLEDWVESLQPPFDPHVEVFPEAHVLRSKVLNAAATSVDAQREGGYLVDQLNGTFAITHGSRQVKAGAVVEFTDDGKRHRVIHATLVAEVGRFKAKATAVALDASGNPLPPDPPQPSEPQKWLARAQGDDALSDALAYFSHSPNWFDTYKALECLRSKYGKTVETWAPKGEVKRLWYNANIHRHWQNKDNTSDESKTPPAPMELKEARQLLAELIRRALQ